MRDRRRTWACAARPGRSPSPTCWRRSRRGFSTCSARASWRGWSARPASAHAQGWRSRYPFPASRPRGRSGPGLLDPAITVAREIRTPDGALLAAAGTRVNPLERMTLSRDLVFVDGRREAEIAWALDREAEGARPARIVLLAGRPLELMRRHRRPFFFDQGGRLAARFGDRGHAKPRRAGGHAAADHRDPGRGSGRCRAGGRGNPRKGELKPC